MTDVEHQLFALGVPVRTRHNEVAPGQYEFAPIFEQANIAADHQQLVMQVLRNTARKHGLVCLLHEKPFTGINGSGKHVNYSLVTDTGMNLLEPGDTPHENMVFLFFCAAMIRAVDVHADLLRICVASASNDHRLGANEAPPAIMSIYLGSELTEIFERLVSGKESLKKGAGLLGLGSSVLPHLPLHSGDRNRTSPFAFTGNKFEFRAVGSSQSISFPITVLNAIVAESVLELTRSVEAAMKKRHSFELALRDVLRTTYSEHSRIVFNGDGYSAQWQDEAKKRGLLNLRTSLDAFEIFLSTKNIKLFGGLNILSKRELEARHEVLLDQYFKSVNIEAETTEWIAQTMVLPAVVRSAIRLQKIAAASEVLQSSANQLLHHMDNLVGALNALRTQNQELGGEDLHSKCKHMSENVLPAMRAVRSAADTLERLCDHDLWPMPGYREMLLQR